MSRTCLTMSNDHSQNNRTCSMLHWWPRKHTGLNWRDKILSLEMACGCNGTALSAFPLGPTRLHYPNKHHTKKDPTNQKKHHQHASITTPQRHPHTTPTSRHHKDTATPQEHRSTKTPPPPHHKNSSTPQRHHHAITTPLIFTP